MTRVYKGSGAKGGKPKLVCTRAKAGAASHAYRSVCLQTLQNAFAQRWQDLLADIPCGDAGGSIDQECANLSALISAIEDEVEQLTVLCLKAPSETLARRLRAKEMNLHSHRAELGRLEEQRAIVDHGLTTARVEVLAIAVAPKMREPVSVAKVNAALRTLFEGVTVDYLTGHLCFHWRQGGATAFAYEWRELNGERVGIYPPA